MMWYESLWWREQHFGVAVPWQVCGLVSLLGKTDAVITNEGLGWLGSQDLWEDLRFTGWPSSPLTGRRRPYSSAHLGRGRKHQSYSLEWWENPCESQLPTVSVYQVIHQRCSNKQGRARAVSCASGATSVPSQHGEDVCSLPQTMKEMPPMQVPSALHHLFSCFSFFYFFFHSFPCII